MTPFKLYEDLIGVDLRRGNVTVGASVTGVFA